jgi:very-short-patch-repair endonuclease
MKLVSSYYPIVLIPDVLQSLVEDSWSDVGLQAAVQRPPLPPQVPWLLEMSERLKALSRRPYLLGSSFIVLMILSGVGLGTLWRSGRAFPVSIGLCLIAVGASLLGWGLREMLLEYRQSHQRSIAVYEQKMQEYRAQSASLRSSQPRRRTRGISRLEAISQALDGKVQLPKASSTAQRGASEAFFFEYLQDVFGAVGEVSFGHQLEIEGYEHNYSTDFTLSFRGLYLDIEIDECYTGKGKKFVPTHCVDDEKDRRREQFFLERGWIVIRFAEEQVVRYPQSCCQVIARVLAHLTGDAELLIEEVSELPAVRQWMKSEARRRYRTHLRKRLLSEIGINFSRGRRKT